ncbi:Methyltransferase-like protein 7B [Vanrija pseudolonga]|uniref:Methyltransferase-like protein 7B n=1 Tax=Vanrija pseudolonga TaxID=143232 RepID=A0AAF0Y1A4_9TREE|nr:Methyltransferase-like protein 7B [Vanrija pseudolonga]
MAPSTFELLAEPWVFLSLSLKQLPTTIFTLVRAGDWASLFTWSTFQDRWFGNLWSWAGPEVRKASEARVIPLLQGRVKAGAILPESEAEGGVYGNVVEVGPGQGNWVSIFTEEYLGRGSSSSGNADTADGLRQRKPHAGVTKVYGVEPNPDQHDGLAKAITEAGMDGVYEIVPYGIQDMGKTGIAKGSIDCIATIMCLCSIPEPEKNVAELYTYLKPGGKWFVYEHVVCYKKQGTFMALYQAFVNLFWPTCMGGCQLRRDTQATLLKAGPWTSVDLAAPVDEQWAVCTPHAYGVLTK